MFYTVYQIVNKINGKVYVGKHITNNLDDGYMGSGKLIRRAIKKYGRDNFFKTIIAVYNNENLMNAVEKFLVAYDPDTTYNLCGGGKGGWGYVNRIYPRSPFFGKTQTSHQKSIAKEFGIFFGNRNKEPEFRNKMSKKMKQVYNDPNFLNHFSGKSHTPESKRLMAKKASLRVGAKNSSYGTMWITNGSENRKIKKLEIMPDGWHRGRTM